MKEDLWVHHIKQFVKCLWFELLSLNFFLSLSISFFVFLFICPLHLSVFLVSLFLSVSLYMCVRVCLCVCVISLKDLSFSHYQITFSDTQICVTQSAFDKFYLKNSFFWRSWKRVFSLKVWDFMRQEVSIFLHLKLYLIDNLVKTWPYYLSLSLSLSLSHTYTHSHTHTHIHTHLKSGQNWPKIVIIYQDCVRILDTFSTNKWSLSAREQNEAKILKIKDKTK